MLYTVVPVEDVLASPVTPRVGEVELAGRRLVVDFTPGGPPRLARLISTDPRDYLDGRLQPGTALPWVASPDSSAADRLGIVGVSPLC